MKRVRLTESDLTRIVKRVINEQGYDEDEMWNSLRHDNNLNEFREKINDIKYQSEDIIGDLRRITYEIKDLTDDINDSNLSDEVKKYMIRNLDIIQDSLDNWYY